MALEGNIKTYVALRYLHQTELYKVIDGFIVTRDAQKSCFIQKVWANSPSW